MCVPPFLSPITILSLHTCVALAPHTVGRQCCARYVWTLCHQENSTLMDCWCHTQTYLQCLVLGLTGSQGVNMHIANGSGPWEHIGHLVISTHLLGLLESFCAPGCATSHLCVKTAPKLPPIVVSYVRHTAHPWPTCGRCPPAIR